MKINKDDIQFVLDKCFKDGVMNAACVGQDVEYEKLASIILKNTKAYDNSSSESRIEV